MLSGQKSGFFLFLCFDFLSVLKVFEDSGIKFLADFIFFEIDDVSGNYHQKRNCEHCELDDKFAFAVDGINRSAVNLDSGNYKSKAYNSGCKSAADFVDKGLDGEGYGFVLFSEFPVSVFNSIRKKHEHKGLDKCLANKNKHRTEIGDYAFIGCNSNLVAPVKIGNNAYTAAGSTVTHDVPDDSLYICREKDEKIINGWVEKKLGKRRIEE